MSTDNYGNELIDDTSRRDWEASIYRMTDAEDALKTANPLRFPGSIDNGAIDTEHSPILYPPKSERFASQNEAIGLLEYKLEQHITQCADGLAPLADFISASWAVIDELVTRIEQLEAAQPIPQIQRLPDGDALTAVYMVGLEDGKRSRPTMDSEGVTLSHDAYDALERELAELRAKDADAEMLQRMVVSLHKTGSESVETIVRLSSDLRGLRAELAAAQAEAARYKALWESVPWEALQDCAQYVDNDDDPERIEMWAHNALALARQWLTANAPKGGAE